MHDMDGYVAFKDIDVRLDDNEVLARGFKKIHKIVDEKPHTDD